jgi:hypothetical protein
MTPVTSQPPDMALGVEPEAEARERELHREEGAGRPGGRERNGGRGGGV